MDSQAQTIQTIAEQGADQPGALLPILHAVQDELGYVPETAVPIIAGVLNLSRAQVHGVVTFYEWYRTSPPGEKTLRICRAEACKSMGADALMKTAQEKLGIGTHETSADGKVSLEPVFCLGNCALAPAVMLDDEIFGRVDADKLEAILE